MKKEPTFEEYQALFENDGVNLPESLSEAAVVEKLDAAQVQQKKKKIKLFPRVLAAAAAVAVVITAVNVIPWRKPVTTVPAAPEGATTGQTQTYTPLSISKAASELSKFSSDADLKAYFQNLYEDRKETMFDALGGVFNGKSVADSAVEYGVAQNSAMTPTLAANETGNGVIAKTAQTSDNYGKTNVRTAGVDEGDVVKNDGRYLYIVASEHFSIVDTQTMERVYQSDVKPKEKNAHYYFSSLYVLGNRLVVTGTLYKGEDPAGEVVYNGAISRGIPLYDLRSESKAVTLIYDVTDRSRPALQRVVTQDGDLESSRMVGSVLYTVTTYSVDVYNKTRVKENYAPAVNEQRLGCDEIYVKDPDKEWTSYVVLTALDTADSGADVEKISMLGRSDELYCTTDTLYVLQDVWSWENDTDMAEDTTEIYAFSLNGTSLSLKASGVVPGTIGDQYAIDQNGVFLRVTTTDYDYRKDADVSSLYVLNDELKIIGALKDFAEDEQVKSTRFLGDLAYVVTFRNTDPLFAIDLSDPAAPKILGSVKLPGFSTYLHPLSETVLLGVGYAGDEESANFSCIKLSLFDISDPTAPRETDAHVIREAESDVNFDPRAFVFDSERGIFGLPVSYQRYDARGEWRGTNYVYKTYTVKDGNFADEKAYLRGSVKGYHYDMLFRGTYIDDKVYTIADTTVKEFDLESCELLRTLTYDDRDYEETDDVIVFDDGMTFDEDVPTTPRVTMPFDPEAAVAPTPIEDETTN